MKLLFIAYFFPPMGGGGVQRSLKFVKYLPEHGITPLVLTATTPKPSHWAPSDRSLEDQLPAGVKIFRTPRIRAAEHLSRAELRLRNWLALTSPFGREWSREAIALGSRICREEKPDAIFVTMSPFEGGKIAHALSSRHGIPWIADLRDPWALDEMQVFSTGFHRWVAGEQMRRQLRSASLVVMNTPEAASRLRRAFPEYRDKPVISLTNGYDAEDFAGPHPSPARPGFFSVVHTGTLHGATDGRRTREALFRAIGRIPPGVDLRCRSHVHLLRALEQWRARSPESARKVRLILAGVCSPADRAMVERSSVRDLVEMPGYCSHAETLRLQRGADLLFLPMHKLPRGARATIVPGKLYEYLATGRPILGAVPEGDAKDFLLRAGSGRICAPDDVDAMERLLRSEQEAWLRGAPAGSPDPDFVRRFERRELTRQLAEHVRAVGERRPATSLPYPGNQGIGKISVGAAPQACPGNASSGLSG